MHSKWNGGTGNYIKGVKQGLYSCANRGASHCTFEFEGSGYDKQVYGAAGLHTSSFVDSNGTLTVDFNASHVIEFGFNPNVEKGWIDRIFKYTPSNPHFNSTFRKQFLGAQKNAFEGE